MEITGKIIAVLPAQGGVSQRTGNPWKSQDYVIETHDQYPKRCCFRVFGEEKINQFNIQLGEEMTVSFDIDSHEYQGRWFNDVRAWAVNRNIQAPGAVPGAGVAPAAPIPGVAPAAPAEAPFPPQQPAAEGGSADDLPF
ncbi:MAG: DUF3127 domain-containing protein [Prevotella sp.]|nr:DUF3127 domain-containing protein [Prevotella sp.]MDY4852014.1 DUF3127 domain-containing protein [Prevotella sp.]